MYMKFIPARVLPGVVAAFLFLLPLAPAFAQQPAASLTLQPAVVEDNASPGQIYKFTLTATNDSNSTQTYYLQSQDISGLDDSGHPIFAQPGQQPTGYELSSWVRLPASSVTLGPGESQAVTVSVDVPQNASPGAHFAGVFFDVLPPQEQTTGAGVGYNVGAVVSLTIAGNVVEDASLREFSTDKFIYSVPDVTFAAKIDNSGNTLVRPNGIIQIHNMLGKDVATINVNSTGGAVFPGSSRTYSVEWKGGGLSFGRYEAVASLAYGDQARHTLTTTTSFWVLPLNLIGSVVGVLLVVVLGLWFFMRLYVRRKLRSMGVNTSGDAGYYQKRYGRSSSRLFVTALAIIVVCVFLLIILFLLFA